MKSHLHLLLIALAFSALSPLSAQQTGDAFSWVDPVVPEPDAEGWITLFDGVQLHGTSPEAIRKNAEKFGISSGYLWIENGGVNFDITARNVALRAEVKKISGQNVMLNCRIEGGKRYSAWFNGGGDFGIGIHRPGWKDLTASRSSVTFPDFFQMEVVAGNSQIMVKADDKMVAFTNDSAIDQAGRVGIGTTSGRSLFRKIQVKNLDAPLFSPETKAKLVQLETQFKAASAKALQPLTTNYQAAVKRALETAQKEFDAGGIAALDLEIKALAAGQTVPPTDAADTPPALVKLRATYRSGVAAASAKPTSLIAQLHDRYDSALSALAQSLVATPAEAAAVNAVRAQIAAARPDSAGRVPISPAVPAKTRLFDGQTLEGWKIAGNSSVFSVVNGAIQGNGPGANIIYCGRDGKAPVWKDFDLSFKLRTDSKANSGVWVHCRPDAGPGSPIALEVQIDNEGGDVQKTGSIWSIQPVSKPLKKDGEWFDMRVVVKGNTIKVFVDGKEVNTWTQPPDWQPPAKIASARLGEGTIGFQSNRGMVSFKDIEISTPVIGAPAAVVKSTAVPQIPPAPAGSPATLPSHAAIPKEGAWKMGLTTGFPKPGNDRVFLVNRGWLEGKLVLADTSWVTMQVAGEALRLPRNQVSLIGLSDWLDPVRRTSDKAVRLRIVISGEAERAVLHFVNGAILSKIDQPPTWEEGGDPDDKAAADPTTIFFDKGNDRSVTLLSSEVTLLLPATGPLVCEINNNRGNAYSGKLAVKFIDIPSGKEVALMDTPKDDKRRMWYRFEIPREKLLKSSGSQKLEPLEARFEPSKLPSLGLLTAQTSRAEAGAARVVFGEETSRIVQVERIDAEAILLDDPQHTRIPRTRVSWLELLDWQTALPPAVAVGTGAAAETPPLRLSFYGLSTQSSMTLPPGAVFNSLMVPPYPLFGADRNDTFSINDERSFRCLKGDLDQSPFHAEMVAAVTVPPESTINIGFENAYTNIWSGPLTVLIQQALSGRRVEEFKSGELELTASRKIQRSKLITP